MSYGFREDGFIYIIKAAAKNEYGKKKEKDWISLDLLLTIYPVTIGSRHFSSFSFSLAVCIWGSFSFGSPFLPFFASFSESQSDSMSWNVG